MTIEIDKNKVTVFDKNCKELDLSGITAIEIRAIAGEPTEAIFTARPEYVTVKDVTRAYMKQLDKGEIHGKHKNRKTETQPKTKKTT